MKRHLFLQERVLICTFIALASGLFGSYLGGQLSVVARTDECKTHQWGLNTICTAFITPVAAWQGSTTGLWVGTILGAFIGGLATRNSQKRIENSELSEVERNLTPAQRDELRRLIGFLVQHSQGMRSRPASPKNTDLELLGGLRDRSLTSQQKLTLPEARDALLALGFSEQLISLACEEVDRPNPSNSTRIS